jgi:hypothetical protein
VQGAVRPPERAPGVVEFNGLGRHEPYASTSDAAEGMRAVIRRWRHGGHGVSPGSGPAAGVSTAPVATLFSFAEDGLTGVMLGLVCAFGTIASTVLPWCQPLASDSIPRSGPQGEKG